MKITDKTLTGERALFHASDLEIFHTAFCDGESPLKESRNITLRDCVFQWKYPLWYSKNITLHNCTLLKTARSGVWYTENIGFYHCKIEAPKTFRRASGILLDDVEMPNAAETFWGCDEVTLKNVTAKGDYFGMNSQNVTAENFVLDGNYCFDGASNIVVRNSKLFSKDSFWNSKNVVVYDSEIRGEYFGWNSENVTLVNCTVESLQGFCYMRNLKLVNCRLENTTLAFEYSTVDAQIAGKVDSVKNPYGGRISADEIGEVILEKDRVDVAATVIETGKK